MGRRCWRIGWKGRERQEIKGKRKKEKGKRKRNSNCK
jgi:hypothetical protein